MFIDYLCANSITTKTKRMKKQTKAVSTPFAHRDAYGAINMPVYHTAAYEFATAADMTDAFCGRVAMPDYSRTMNPTVTYFEDKVRALTGARDVIAMNSGMAAISNTLMTLSQAGKNIVTSRHLFGNTFSLITASLARFGIEARLCDLTDSESVRKVVDDDTCCIFLEIITNPQMEVADLSMLASIAHERGSLLVADTTIIPFTEFELPRLGVDIEIVSSTKYVSGGATSLGGLVIDYGTAKGFGEKMRSEMVFNFGAYMTPHVAYMQTLGLETMDARYRVQSNSALVLAERLKELPQVKRVNYVGLKDNPYHELAARQFGPTAGAMICFDLASDQACFSFINHLQLVRRATNLFDNKSLAIHPYSTIFGNFTRQQRKDMDVLDTTIRLSIGLEDPDDLFDDLSQAIQATE